MESTGSRKSSGSEFQTVGEAWKKPRGPIVFVFVRGTTRRRSWNRAERREERVHRDAIVVEVLGSESVEALVDK